MRGASGNFVNPANNINFGQLFTDRADTIQMNQAMLTLERDINSSAPGYDFGFKLQGMYGTDSRFTHFFNELDRVTNSPYQWDVTEADVQAHLPWLTSGGVDAKIGQYPTPLGYEGIDHSQNLFYSHSYIFDFGLPFKHTGILTTTHVDSTLDIWAGLDTGVNDSVGTKGINNDEFPKALGGFGLNNLLGGKLTILALAHIGPENPIGVPQYRSALREYYDIVTIYKISNAWTSTTELNAVHDDYFDATAGGVAQYLSYAVNSQITLNARAEMFADEANRSKGFGGFVCADPGSFDAVDAQRGLLPNTSYCGGSVTYGELTLGVSYKPPVPYGSITIRPEVRYDTDFSGGKVFDMNSAGVNTRTGEFTTAMDIILAF